MMGRHTRGVETVMAKDPPDPKGQGAGLEAEAELPAVLLFYAFRSPYCYLVTERACQLPACFSARLEWRFVYPAAGSHEERMETPEVAYMGRDALRCAEAQGLELNLPDFVIQGRLAALGATFACRQDRGEAFVRAAARAYWVEGRDIDEASVLMEVAEAAGLDSQAFVHALTDRRFEGVIRANRREARELGVFGVPTFVIEKELFWGNDRYAFVVAELARRGLAR